MDWVALYGAILSTVLAAVALWNRWRRDLFLTVNGVHPNENWIGNGELLAFAITNSGRRPTVVRRIQIELLSGVGRVAEKVGEASFDHSSNWNPAQKDLPVEGKPGKSRRVPNVLQPGDELHGNAKPISDYRPSKHAVKITAFARNSNRGFVGWIKPREGSA